MARIQLYFKQIYINRISINRAGVIYIGYRARLIPTEQEMERRVDAWRLLKAVWEEQEVKVAALRLLQRPLSAQQITNAAYRAQQKEAPWKAQQITKAAWKAKVSIDNKQKKAERENYLRELALTNSRR